ncbi:MCE family protein [Fodinicola acaciae]|uniref:MCE family protein n=1 Tax=Fodinicola acaciae TaxID=2681555 RepID=UPI0013D4787C|nr:MCE family protein [Fodinicola acaciae]
MSERPLDHPVFKFLPIALVIVLVAAVGGLVYVINQPALRTLTANFTETVGIYPGSDVRILGVKVGTVTEVTPVGGQVRVRMNYDDKFKVPADAVAVIVPPSLVSDRYVQLSPVYQKGALLPEGAVLGTDRTAVPIELDQIYRDLNDLNTALGPEGANRTGALNRLLAAGRANLQGNGDNLNTTTANLSKAIQTLADHRGDTFGTVANLQKFVATLAASDDQVRTFNSQLNQVAGQLNAERTDLAAAVRSLSIALAQVQGFVHDNRDILSTDVAQLTSLTQTLAKQKASLADFLDVAPLAVSNVALTYNATSGTLDTRDNAISGLDPALALCSGFQLAGTLTKDAGLRTACVAIAQMVTRCKTGILPQVLKPLAILPPVKALPCSYSSLPNGTFPTFGAGSVPSGGTDTSGNGAVDLPVPGSGVTGITGPIDRTLGGILGGGGR